MTSIMLTGEPAIRGRFTWQFKAYLLAGLLATELALLPGRCQLPVPFAVNLLLASGQQILRRDVAYGTVQADVVVMLDVALHEAPRSVLQEQQRACRQHQE